MDPDAVVQCPYDRSHQVRESRLPYHLVRCQQNNPQVSRTLATCPFNARHRVPRALLRAHVASCPDKLPLELPPGVSPGVSQLCPLTAVPCVPADPEEDMAKTAHTWQPPPCQEDWDAELSELELEEPPPFILQVTKGDLPVPCHRPPQMTPPPPVSPSPDPAAPPEGLALRKPRPATAAPRLGTAGQRLGTAGQRLGTAGPRLGTAGPRSGQGRSRPGTAGGNRGVAGPGGAPPAVKYLRK
ncbi:gametocyte-specific factor 1 [Ammospiza nelsoni]|uniref:gametocyte-specific factor 1 n=1 Tax=Ammospiza nelsoni TaxID=2857394 RepID=UPI00286D0EC3|nr:gametocyte-specific factor 1 [Ammospiza nelsoni]